MEVNEVEWAQHKGTLERLSDYVLGNDRRPALEDRIRSYVDQRDNHKERNAEQSVLDLRSEFNEKHRENVTRQDKAETKTDALTRLVYIGFGIVITLNSVIIIGLGVLGAMTKH